MPIAARGAARVTSTLDFVKLFRRVLLAVGIAALVAVVAKLRRNTTVTPSSGGWRQLDGPQFR